MRLIRLLIARYKLGFERWRLSRHNNPSLTLGP